MESTEKKQQSKKLLPEAIDFFNYFVGPLEIQKIGIELYTYSSTPYSSTPIVCMYIAQLQFFEFPRDQQNSSKNLLPQVTVFCSAAFFAYIYIYIYIYIHIY